jgi:cytochrome c-type biogenesis protein CcmH/NrfG
VAESRQETPRTRIHPAIRLLAALQIPLALVALGIFTFISFRIKPLIDKEQELQNKIDEQKHALEDARNQLAKTRSAIEYVRFGINSFQAGNFSEAVRAYDRAIELDRKDGQFTKFNASPTYRKLMK